MSFPQSRLALSLALSLLWPATAFAQTPITQPKPDGGPHGLRSAAGYHWHTLALQHAKPSDILASMHWNRPATPEAPALFAPAPFDLLPLTGSPAPSSATLPDGVSRIFALQSTNSLLVEATEEGYATVTKLVRIIDSAPRQVEFDMALVAVPAARADLSAPDVPASRLLPLLLAGESRVIPVPTETTTEGVTASVSVEVPVSVSGGRFRLAQARPGLDGHGPSAHCEFRLTPRINADGTVTLSLTFATGRSLSPTQAAPRTVRAGEMVAYEVTGAAQADRERLFFFLSPVIVTP